MNKVAGVMAVTGANAEAVRRIRRIAARFEKINNMPVYLFTEDELGDRQMLSGHFARYYMWELLPTNVDRIIYIDTDVIPMNPIEDIPQVDFAAVPERPALFNGAAKHWPVIGLGGFYFNSGIFVASRNTDDIFQAVLDRQSDAADGKWPWLHDQTLLNVEVHVAAKHGRITVESLQRKWNFAPYNADQYVKKPYFLHLARVSAGRPHVVGRLVEQYLDCLEPGASVKGILEQAYGDGQSSNN